MANVLLIVSWKGGSTHVHSGSGYDSAVDVGDLNATCTFGK